MLKSIKVLFGKVATMTPLENYLAKCKEGVILEDTQQLNALSVLDQVFFGLIAEHKKRESGFSFLRKSILVKGVYLWGGVGIGKTLIMDCFFHALPFKNKMRMHFHQFMQSIHNQLTEFQGKKDPLNAIAKDLAKKTMILCFDEFIVSDITDAMLLKGLLESLFEQGVCLVATSNSAPDDLYKHGLQRSQFIPVIELLKKDTTVIHLPSSVDYRLRHLQEAGVFYSPLTQENREKMQKTFEVLAAGKKISTDPIEIYGRKIKIIKQAGDIIWFDFAKICSVPRSQKDYLAIAKQYRTVFISDIPTIGPNEKDMICLFISLVDVFYDAGVRLVVSSVEPVSQIYSRGYMIAEYARTNSRLLEMQSTDYFAGEFDWKHK